MGSHMHDISAVGLIIRIMLVMPGRMLVMIRGMFMMVDLHGMRVLDIVHMGQSVVPCRQRQHAQQRQYPAKREDARSEAER